MAVYLTRTMLNRMNQVRYPNSKFESENSTSDHWQKLFCDGNKSEKLSFAMICRVCGRDGCTPITEKFDGYSIYLAIRSVTNVSVDTNDSLPKYICTECLQKLKGAIDFKKECEASERKFKKILNPQGDPSLHSYPYSKHDFQLILHDMKVKKMKIEEDKEKDRLSRERTIQKPKGKEFKCTSCDMTFPSKEQLSRHRRERQCMRRACDICGQLVVSIKLHMRQIHKQISTHKCPTCGREFPIFARLKNHMMIHTNTFNFFCDLCPYKCKHKYYLVMHMRTHTGEKPYKCQLCPATFVNPSNLNKHRLTHQEKQFKCVMCEKSFRTNTGLREHHEATHMNIKHTCNFCGRDFCYRSDLRKHEIRNHNRTKRDYIGGEPTYKLVERMQKQEETPNVIDTTTIDKWHAQEIIVAATHIQPQHVHSQPQLLVQSQPHGPQPHVHSQPQVRSQPQVHQSHIQPQPQTQIIQATYIDTRQPNQAIYFSDVSGMMTSQTIHQMVPMSEQTVEITLPELTLKKDDAEAVTYETQELTYY